MLTYVTYTNVVAQVDGEAGIVASHPAIAAYYKDSFAIAFTSGQDGVVTLRDLTVDLCCRQPRKRPSTQCRRDVA